MLLYHGSNVIVENPRIITPNRYLDFSDGFYTTSNYTQAESFAKKVYARKKCGEFCVNVYEFDENALVKFNVLEFSSPDGEWLDFVSNCRNGISPPQQYDIIIGPVADDDIFRTFLLYQTGALTREQTIQALKVKKLFNQYVFSTDCAISALKYIKTDRGVPINE